MKHLKDSFEVARLDADPVIAGFEAPLITLLNGRDPHFKPAFAAKLKRVINQVFKHQVYLRSVGQNFPERIDSHNGVRLRYVPGERLCWFSVSDPRIGRNQPQIGPSEMCRSRQDIQYCLNAITTADDETEKLSVVVLQVIGNALFEQLAKTRHYAGQLVGIEAGHINEMIQLCLGHFNGAPTCSLASQSKP